MDIVCLNCGEPWDVLTVADEPDEFERGKDRLSGRPNGKITRCPCCPKDGSAHPPENAELIQVLAELSGDDIDGLAADLEDFGLL